MAEEPWHAARLIPTSGINGAEEQERRASSALLAVLGIVKEYGKAMLSPLGALSGNVETFIEVPFMLGEHRHYPDGLIRVSRGQRSWTALVEVKTGSNKLEVSQLEAYLDIAREQGFDALLTISNEIAAIAGTHPTVLDKRKLRRVALHHLSWTQVLTEAVMQKVHRGVSDSEQAWILGELIRYLEHPRSGAMEFEDMGPAWVSVREAVSHGTLRPNDKGVAEVSSRWDQLMRYTCLRMGRQLGVEVQPVLSRKELSEPAVRAQALGRLPNGARRPRLRGSRSGGGWAVVHLRRSSDRPCQRLDRCRRPEGRACPDTCELASSASEGRARHSASDTYALHARGVTTSQLLRDARQDPALMVSDPKRELRMFRLTMSAPMGSKRGQGRGSFVSSVLDLVDVFYRDVIEGLRPWAVVPPKLRSDQEMVQETEVATSLVSTALSSQDGVDTPVAVPVAAPEDVKPSG